MTSVQDGRVTEAAAVEGLSTQPAEVGPAPRGRVSPLAPFRRAWRQLTSMRTALLLLFLLALGSVPGGFLRLVPAYGGPATGTTFGYTLDLMRHDPGAPNGMTEFLIAKSAAALDERGIGYVHLRPPGTPKPGRDAVRAGHPERMKAIFRAHMQGDEPQAALAEATALAHARRCCLLCFERDPAHCHRCIVAEMIQEKTGQSIKHLQPG